MINNLVSNAIKALAESKGHRHLSLAWRVEKITPEGFLPTTIQISDTGCGISPEAIGKIFQSGARLHQDQYSQEGSVYGLYNCKKIVEKQLNGTISVRSQLGKGSTFTVRLALPIAKAIAEVRQPQLKENKALSIIEDQRLIHDLQHPLAIIIQTIDLIESTLNRLSEAKMIPQLLAQNGKILKAVLKLQVLIRSCLTNGAQSPQNRSTSTVSLSNKPIKWRIEKRNSLPKVLFADDHPTSRRLMEHQLKKTPLNYVIVEDGEDVLKRLFSKVRSDNLLLILDSQMKKISGPEVAKTLRKKGVMVPIIGLSAFANQEDKNHFLAAGMHKHIHVYSKPMEFNRVMRRGIKMHRDYAQSRVRSYSEEHKRAP